MAKMEKIAHVKDLEFVDTDKIEKIEKKENKKGIKGMAYRFLKGDKIKNKNKIKKDKQELINNINKNIDDMNKKIFYAMQEQIALIFRYYSVDVFKKELNRVMKGAGSLMYGLYADWQLPTMEEVQRKVTLKFNEATLKSLNEKVLDRPSEDDLGKISEKFNEWKQDFDKNYINRIKSMLKLLIAMKWKKLISAAKKSISARGFARNVEKIPRIVLDPLKKHIENVFGNCDYDSVQKINNYISDFENALPVYESKEIKNDTYEFFNSVYNRQSAAFADEYKDASALGKNVTNTTYLLFKYAAAFSDEANNVYSQLVEKVDNMVLEEINKDIEPTVKKLLPILTKLKQHIYTDVFRQADYDLLNDICGYTDEFIKALKDYKKIYISNDACDFFNSFISNNKIRVDKNIGVTNTVWLLIGYSSKQFSIESFLEKIDKDILCEIKNIINNHKSVIEKRIRALANNQIESKNKKKLTKEDAEKNKDKAPLVSALIRLSDIIVNLKGKLSDNETRLLTKFLEDNYKSFVCLEGPAVSNILVEDKETEKIIISFMNFLCKR